MQDLDGAPLLQQEPEQIQRYLLTVDQPDWTLLKVHPRFTEQWAIFFLKRARAIPKSSIQEIYQDKQLRKNYQVNLHLVRCKFTPAPLAMNLCHTLRWMDLLNTLRILTLAGPVRQRVESLIMERFPRLSLGEKVTTAKMAPRGLVKHLRSSEEPRVLRALFNNYHFTYEDATFMANYPETKPNTLGELAMNQKWRRYKEIRKSLLRNPKTPRSMVYPLASSLNDFDLREALKNIRLTTYTRRIIQKVLEEKLYSKKKH